MIAVPAAPLNVTVNQVERVSGGGSVTITASWIRPPNFELFDIDRYDINVSSASGIQQMATTCGECTNTTVTVTEDPSNVHPSTTFTISISARNRCGETGPTATASYTLSKSLHLCIEKASKPRLSVPRFCLAVLDKNQNESLEEFSCDTVALCCQLEFSPVLSRNIFCDATTAFITLPMVAGTSFKRGWVQGTQDP